MEFFLVPCLPPRAVGLLPAVRFCAPLPRDLAIDARTLCFLFIRDGGRPVLSLPDLSGAVLQLDQEVLDRHCVARGADNRCPNCGGTG